MLHRTNHICWVQFQALHGRTWKKPLSQVNARCLPPAPAQVRSSSAGAAPATGVASVMHESGMRMVCAPMSASASSWTSFHLASGMSAFMSCINALPAESAWHNTNSLMNAAPIVATVFTHKHTYLLGLLGIFVTNLDNSTKDPGAESLVQLRYV